MPKINIETPSQHSDQETFSKLKSFFDEDKDLRKMDSSYTCTYDDAGLKGTAKGSKFTADMSVKSQGDGAAVSICVEIPFMLSPFKGKIEETLVRKLGKVLA